MRSKFAGLCCILTLMLIHGLNHEAEACGQGASDTADVRQDTVRGIPAIIGCADQIVDRDSILLRSDRVLFTLAQADSVSVTENVKTYYRDGNVLGRMYWYEQGEVFILGGAHEVAYIASSSPTSPPLGGLESRAWKMSGTGVIQGEVIDSVALAPAKGVTVALVGTRLVTLTDEDGKYIFEKVPSGSYEIIFSAEGYRTAKVKGVTVTRRKRIEVPHVLERLKAEG